MTALSSLASTWKAFDISGLQGRLDETAESVVAKQSDSEVSRANLVQKLQEFFQDPDLAQARTAAGPIIKLFQAEIDLLDSRCVGAETAFLEAWKSVGSMTDPVSTLEAAAEKAAKVNSKLTDSELVVAQLKETVGLYEDEIVGHKKRDKEFQKLKTKLEAYDKNIDATLNERMVEVTQRLTLEADDRVKAVEDEKAAAERKYEDLKTEMDVHRRQLESAQTELFEHHQRASEASDARVAEADMLVHDVEAWQQRATLAEKEVESLREKLEANPSAQPSDWQDLQSNIQDLERRLSSKEREIERLVGQLTVVSDQLACDQQTSSSRTSELESRLAEASAAAQNATEKLDAMSDYETVKKELGILRSLEFPSSEDENKPVEVLILERSKHLQSENTSLRMDKERLARSLDETSGELAEKCKEFERQSQLVAELEVHVDQLQQIRNKSDGRSSVDILRDISPSAAAAASHTPDQAGTPTTDLLSSPDGSNMLPIVQAQRERYRQRAQELEDERGTLQQQMQVVQAEAKQLSADNVKLYEKIRFLQGFGAGSSSSSARGLTTTRSNAVEVEARYQTQYEQRLDPFTTFSNQEKQKRYGNLNIAEKLILWMVRFMMSNKVARLMIFAYSVFLHMLVFMVLMRMAYSESHARHVAEEVAWKRKLEDHMRDHHDGVGLPHG